MAGDKIDPSRAYQVRLPSKKTINVFFYDGPISQGVAFEGSAERRQTFCRPFAQLDFPMPATGRNSRTSPPTAKVTATTITTAKWPSPTPCITSKSNKLAELTNYGQFLEKHPPDHLAEIVDDTSWSCVHGVERWRSNCGCNSGGHGNWNQAWRAPLRAALDWLRDCLAPGFEQKSAFLLKDPWRARDEYIRVILDRSDESVAAFFADHATHPLSDDEQVTALKLLEMQRHAMLMYTSCGWFFDELSGLETVQVLHYAGHAVQLAKQVLGGNIEQGFLEKLRAAKSNLPEHGDGAQIYEKWVVPACVDMEKLAGHYAISSLFENYGEKTKIYCYDVDREDYSLEAEGKLRLATGRAKFRSEITHDSATMSFAVIHLGDHNITGGAKPSDQEADQQIDKTLERNIFSRGDR